MPIGLVSDHDFQKELDRSSRKESHVKEDVVVEAEIIDTPARGRKTGDVNVPDSLRKVIADTHLLEGRDAALDLAREFGVSSSSVSAYAKGATSTTSYHEPKPTILDHINKARQRAIKRASKTLNGALNAITQDKLDYTDAKDLSIIAKNMSAVIKDLEPPQDTPTTEGKSTPQFIIYAPQFRKEETFEFVNVTE